MDTGRATPPRTASIGASSGSAKDTAAVAEARKPARVMPIWIVARNWLGSRARRASSAPLLPCCSSFASWASRRLTRAISLPANSAFITTSTPTSPSWSHMEFIAGQYALGPVQWLVVPTVDR